MAKMSFKNCIYCIINDKIFKVLMNTFKYKDQSVGMEKNIFLKITKPVTFKSFKHFFGRKDVKALFLKKRGGGLT